MKKRSFIFNRTNLLVFLLAGCFTVLFSCKKDIDTATGLPKPSRGTPTIERVRLTDTTTRDSSLHKATLGSTLVIIGNNLGTAQKVVFNGYEEPVNPTYATDKNLVITISDSVPTIATNPNVPNELKVVTADGEVTYQFQILPPRPEVDHISNEYVQAGDQITIYGKYFFFVDTVYFPGNVKVTEGITTSANGQALTVTVPQGFDPTQGDVQVKSQSGLSAPVRESKLYDITAKPGRMINWDAQNSWGGTLNFGWGLDEGKKVVTNWSGITPIDGKFAVIDMAVPGNWGWSNDKVINMNNWDGSINSGDIFPHEPSSVYDPNAPLSNFDLKLEVAATKPINGLQVQVWQNDFTASANLADFVKSTDGKWYTVSVNLGNMAKGSGKLAKLKDLYATKELRVLIVNPTSSDVITTIAVDNIRIVRVM